MPLPVVRTWGADTDRETARSSPTTDLLATRSRPSSLQNWERVSAGCQLPSRGGAETGVSVTPTLSWPSCGPSSSVWRWNRGHHDFCSCVLHVAAALRPWLSRLQAQLAPLGGYPTGWAECCIRLFAGAMCWIQIVLLSQGGGGIPTNPL